MEQVKQRGNVQIVTECFYKNYMVLGLGKYQLKWLRKNKENETFFCNDTEMKKLFKRSSEVAIGGVL